MNGQEVPEGIGNQELSVSDSLSSSNTSSPGDHAVPPTVLFPTVKIKIKIGSDNSNMEPSVISGNEDSLNSNEEGRQALNHIKQEDASNVNGNELISTPEKRGRESKRKAAAAVSAVADEGEEEEEVEEKSPPPAGAGLSEEIFEVEKILDHRMQGRRRVFLVSWRGYGSDEDSWEPETNLGSAKKAIEVYMKKKTPAPSTAKKEKKAKSSTPSSLKRGRGRPPKGRDSETPKVKKSRVEKAHVEEEEQVDDHYAQDDEDEDYGTPTKSSKAKTKAELKIFPKSTPSSSPIKRVHLEHRQNWLTESGSDESSSDEDEAKPKPSHASPPKHTKKAEQESVARALEMMKPKREWQQRDAAKEEPEERSERTRKKKSDASTSKQYPVIDGVFRQSSNSEVRVVLRDSPSAESRMLSLREAHDTAGWALVEYLADRIEFEE